MRIKKLAPKKGPVSEVAGEMAFATTKVKTPEDVEEGAFSMLLKTQKGTPDHLVVLTSKEARRARAKLNHGNERLGRHLGRHLAIPVDGDVELALQSLRDRWQAMAQIRRDGDALLAISEMSDEELAKRWLLTAPSAPFAG